MSITKFWQLIDTAIPDIVDILKNSDNPDVCMKCVDTLTELSEKGKS